jgi:hypothetical protein
VQLTLLSYCELWFILSLHLTRAGVWRGGGGWDWPSLNWSLGCNSHDSGSFSGSRDVHPKLWRSCRQPDQELLQHWPYINMIFDRGPGPTSLTAHVCCWSRSETGSPGSRFSWFSIRQTSELLKHKNKKNKTFLEALRNLFSFKCFHVLNGTIRNYKIKVKLKLPLCFSWAPRHDGLLGEWRYSSTHSLISALDGGEWSASRPGHFNPRERALCTHWIGGWVDPSAVLDNVVQFPAHAGNRTLEPRSSSR